MFETQPNLAIDDLTQHAYAVLGKNGEIPGAREHTCSDCTKPFKRTMQDTELIPGTLDVNTVVFRPTVRSLVTSDHEQNRSGACHGSL